MKSIKKMGVTVALVVVTLSHTSAITLAQINASDTSQSGRTIGGSCSGTVSTSPATVAPGDTLTFNYSISGSVATGWVGECPSIDCSVDISGGVTTSATPLTVSAALPICKIGSGSVNTTSSVTTPNVANGTYNLNARLSGALQNFSSTVYDGTPNPNPFADYTLPVTVQAALPPSVNLNFSLFLQRLKSIFVGTVFAETR